MFWSPLSADICVTGSDPRGGTLQGVMHGALTVSCVLGPQRKGTPPFTDCRSGKGADCRYPLHSHITHRIIAI